MRMTMKTSSVATMMPPMTRIIVPPRKPLWMDWHCGRGAGFHIILTLQPSKPKHLAVAMQWVSTKAKREQRCIRSAYDCVALGAPKDRVRRELLETVGREVQTGQFIQICKSPLGNEGDEVMIQTHLMEVDHLADGFPRHTAQVVIRQIQILQCRINVVKGCVEDPTQLIVVEDQVLQVDQPSEVV
ncbi:hypothetical protein EYF80_032633 [Liparis tanakae]|uniref:Uncharacterized protein n=1 Tax=Liparis tanakae TaxID=230148 RepID=A0A4Z2GV64_9TELE|nr:hypothetical protein EYF80_032633 [Liparis tanakae]